MQTLGNACIKIVGKSANTIVRGTVYHVVRIDSDPRCKAWKGFAEIDGKFYVVRAMTNAEAETPIYWNIQNRVAAKYLF